MARTRQPQGLVRVNSKWLSRGMVASFNPAVGFVDLARNNNASGFVGNITNSVGTQGRAWGGDTQNSDNYVSVPRTSDLAYTGGVTFEALVTANAFNTTIAPYLSGIISQYTNSTNWGPLLRFNNDGTIGNAAKPCFIVPSGSTEYSAVGSAQAAGALLHLIGLYDGASVCLWVNGTKTVGASLSGSIRNDAANQITLLSDFAFQNVTEARCFNGKLFFANIYNRGLTDAEAIERTQFPWGHLNTDPRRIWVQLGSAAGTTNATIASTETTNSTSIVAVPTVGASLTSTQTTDSTSIISVSAIGRISATQNTDSTTIVGNATSTTYCTLAATETTNSTTLQAVTAIGRITANEYENSTDIQAKATVNGTIASTEITNSTSFVVSAATGGAAFADISCQQLSDLTGIDAKATTGASISSMQGPDDADIFAQATVGAFLASQEGTNTTSFSVTASAGTGSLDQTTIDAIATAVWTQVLDAGISAEGLMRIMASHAAGDATGLENGSPNFKSLDGTKNRITGTYTTGTRVVTNRDAS